MIPALLLTGLVLGLACAWTRRTGRDFTRAGYAMGWTGLALWTVAFVDLYMKVA